MCGGWAESLECLPEWGLDHHQGSGWGEDTSDPGAGSDTEVRMQGRETRDAKVRVLDVHCLLIPMTTQMHTSFQLLQLSALSAMRHTEETGRPQAFSKQRSHSPGSVA